jgi:hypothetical protein
MSGTFPTSPSFETVNFKINTPTLRSESFSGKTRRVGMGVSFYTFSVKFPNVTAYNFGPILGFITAQYGSLDSFQIVLPEISYSKSLNPPSTTPTAGNTAIGSNVVYLSNCGNTKTVLAAGDYFKFSNHSKVYMCTSDCISNSGGLATLYFSASLVTALTGGTTTLVMTAVPFTVILDGDVQEYSVGSRGISTATLDMREVW